MGTITGENPAAAPEGAVRAAELAIGEMTCASCAARIEKKLNKLDGVAATVNFATETARAVPELAVGLAGAGLPGRGGGRGRFTAPRSSTPGTAPPPWTR